MADENQHGGVRLVLADQDPTALIAQNQRIGRRVADAVHLGRRQDEVAAAAGMTVEWRSTDPAELLPQLFVAGQQRLGDVRRQPVPRPSLRPELGIDLGLVAGDRCVDAAQFVGDGVQLGLETATCSSSGWRSSIVVSTRSSSFEQ